MSIPVRVEAEDLVNVDKRRLDSLSTDSYRKFKMKILKRDFHVQLTQQQKDHFESLKTDGDIERYFNQLINTKMH